MKTEMLYKILNSLIEGIIVVDTTGRIMMLNDEACRLVGLDKDRSVGRHVVGTIPNTRLHTVLETGIPEYDQIQPLDDKIIVTSRIPLKDAKGTIYGVMAVFRDVTSIEKMVEEVTSLKKIEALLSEIINSTHDAISVADETGNISMVNKAYTRITGLSANKVIGKPATVDIAEGPSLHQEVTITRKPIYNARLRVGPGKREVIVNVTPIFVNDVFKGSVGVIHDITEMQHLVGELEDTRRLLRHIRAKYTFDDIAGESHTIRVAIEQAKRVAVTRVTVLLRGPSGTGKELFAHAIHNASDRVNKSFISVNCAALPESILESELFGYSEGAFTGAKKGGKKGILAEADGGTVFLDEVGKMSVGVQSKFLRFLQDKEVIPVGSNKPLKLDVRIIAATNLDLEDRVARGEFLSDLYYRLNVVPIRIPSLKERKEDIPEISRRIIMRLNQEFGRLVEGLSEDALDSLIAYDWPGNVLELENIFGHSMSKM